MTTPSDEELVLALQDGKTESLGLLVARWEQPLFRFAYRLLQRPEEARDVVQETFLRILKKRDRFEEGSRFSTWMYQIALNLSRDHLRRKKRWSHLVVEPSGRAGDHAPPPEAVATEEGPALALERAERRRVVASALGELPPEQRTVLVLKEYEGLKFREIAEVLGCPESTVKSRMYYGLAGLRAALERRGIRDAS